MLQMSVFSHFREKLDQNGNPITNKGGVVLKDQIFRTIEVSSFEELIKIIQNQQYSFGVFGDNGHRCKEDFLSTSAIALDIDEGMEIEKAKEIFKPYKHVIIGSRNHRIEKHGAINDRFRVILFLEVPIKDTPTFKATMKYLDGLCGGVVDQSIISDSARFYFPSPHDPFSINEKGTLLAPICITTTEAPGAATCLSAPLQQRGELSFETKEFIHIGVSPRTRNTRCNKAAFDLRAQKYPKEQAFALLKSSPCVTDKNSNDPFPEEEVLTCVESAYDPSKQIETSLRLPRRRKLRPPITEYLTEFMEENKCVYLHKTDRFAVNGEDYTLERLLTKFDQDQLTRGYNYPGRILMPTLKEYREQARKRLIEKVKERITFDPTLNDEALDLLCKTVDKDRTPLTKAIIKHSIWQAKRKLHGRKVDHHMMTVFVGPTRAGKSVLVDRLLSPFDEVVGGGLNASIFTDERNYHVFEDFFFIPLDELSRLSKQEVESVKHVITAPYLKGRILGKNAHNTFTNNAVFVGTSEIPINKVFRDTTSGRRMWQIDTFPVLDWPTINSIDYLSIAKTVDESKESPITNCLTEIKDFQDSHIRALPVHEEFYIDALLFDNKGNMSPKELWDLFEKYCVSFGIKHPPARRPFMVDFNKLLDKLGISVKTSNGCTVYPFKTKIDISESETLDFEDEARPPIRAVGGK